MSFVVVVVVAAAARWMGDVVDKHRWIDG